MKSLASLGLVIICSGAMPAQPPNIKVAMHGVYAKLEKAYNKGDLVAIMGYFSSDYKWTMLDGKVLKRSDARTNLKEEFANIQSGKWHVTLVNVIGSGPVATVVAQYKFVGVKLNNSHPYKSSLTSTERQNWIKGSDGWKQISDVILSASTKSFGQVVSPSVKAGGRPIQSRPQVQGNNNRPSSGNNPGH